MDDDLYFWSKNRNIIFRRDIVRNASAHLGMAHLKTDGILIKMIHVSSEDGGWTEEEQKRYEKTFLHDDLVPSTIYSLNKRKRWETEWSIGAKLLDDAYTFHEGKADVLIFERVNLKTFEWKYCPIVRFPKDFLIRSVHRLKKDKDGTTSYERLQQNSIFGQTYSHFLEENRKSSKGDKESPVANPSTIVVYNFVRPPKNYMVLGEQCFVASNYGGRYPYSPFNRRIENYKNSEMEIRYSDFHEDFDDLDENFEENSRKDEYIQNERAKFYNLYEHLRESFVFVKRRSSRKDYSMTKDQSSTCETCVNCQL